MVAREAAQAREVVRVLIQELAVQDLRLDEEERLPEQVPGGAQRPVVRSVAGCVAGLESSVKIK